MAVFIIYRPPGYATLGFVNEFESLLLHVQNCSLQKLHVGDFNIWMDDSTKTDVRSFTAAFENFNIDNLIHNPTHKSGHILDLLFVESNSVSFENVTVEPSNSISDHKVISFRMKLGNKTEFTKSVTYRKLRNFYYERFCEVFMGIARRCDSQKTVKVNDSNNL